MKKTFTQWVMILAGLVVFQVQAQQVQTRNNSIKQLQSDRSAVEVSKQFENYVPNHNFSNNNPENVADALNYPLEGTMTLYVIGGGGYVSGNNDYLDKAKANIFELNQPHLLTGVLIDFGVAVGNNDNVEVAFGDQPNHRVQRWAVRWWICKPSSMMLQTSKPLL